MSFDFLARHYRWMEAVLAGDLLQRARVRWLDALNGRKRVLLVGEGPGRLLGEVLRNFPDADVTVVEKSAAMIAVAARWVEKKGVSLGRVNWVNEDVRAWAAERRGAVAQGIAQDGDLSFDAVVTPFVLDCFAEEELARVIEGLGEMAASDAVWLIADFQVPERGWRRWRARMVHAVMYRFFRVATKLEAARLTRPDEVVRHAGFVLRSRAIFNAGLVHSDVWERGREKWS